MDTKYGEIKIYAETIENEAISQVYNFANSPLGKDAHIRIMPDAHAGAGCVIGTTMLITDKVCPNIVGVDIGCGVDLVQLSAPIDNRLDELDAIIYKSIPFGQNVHPVYAGDFPFEFLRCWDKLTKETQETARKSMGTLGGGNHFIEAYEDGWIAVHSGSRNIGYKVAAYYQKLAEQHMKDAKHNEVKRILEEIPPKEREVALTNLNKMIVCPKDFAYLEGEQKEDYLHDMYIMQDFAVENRKQMLDTIARELGLQIKKYISSTHNYIAVNGVLRKGAIAAYWGQELVIPLNMRDGVLICEGKGNEDWNYSAPHGAGRLYSRSEAKKLFTLDEYEESMKGIYSTSINDSTIDEAPFVYKNWEEIAEAIEPTVKIKKRLIPIYNFKANS